LDLSTAQQLGYTIKLLAVGNRSSRGVDLRVHPTLLDSQHPLSSVNGVFNAIFVVGDAVGETMFYGQGAGSGPAASAVVGDLIEVAQRITYGISRPYIRFGTEQLPLMPIDELVSRYYLRLPVPDRAGAVAATAQAFARHEVSIEHIMQFAEPGANARLALSADTANDLDTNDANLIYVTHPTREAEVKAVLAQIQASGILTADPLLLRIMD
jgi:homoserine dehydrogenase